MRGKLDVEDLLKIVLALVAVWLVLGILGRTLDLLGTLFSSLLGIMGVLIIVLVVLWFLDYI